MTVNKIDTALPRTSWRDSANEALVELNGKIAQASFDKNEISYILSGAGLTKAYIRDLDLGSSATGSNAWWNWAHVQAEDGYSVWKWNFDSSLVHDSDNEVYMDNQLMKYQGSATAEKMTAFGTVYTTTDGVTFTNRTAEAATPTGTEFSLLSATSDYIYIGDNSTFGGIDFDFQTKGRGHTLVVEYYRNTGSWTTMSAAAHTLDDNTGAFVRDGAITYDIPTDWATTAINSVTRYWIRISTSATPTTVAKAYFITPYNSVISLLRLSSAELENEEWKSCSWSAGGSTGARLYITARNAGSSAYEGNYYVTTSSSDANKENFFRFNHKFTANVKSSGFSYESSGLAQEFTDGSSDVLDVGEFCYLSAAATVDRASALDNTKVTIGICTGKASTSTKRLVTVGSGVVTGVKIEGDQTVSAGDELWLATGSTGRVSNAAPSASGNIVQRVGRAHAAGSGVGGTVKIILGVETEFIEIQ